MGDKSLIVVKSFWDAENVQGMVEDNDAMNHCLVEVADVKVVETAEFTDFLVPVMVIDVDAVDDTHALVTQSMEVENGNSEEPDGLAEDISQESEVPVVKVQRKTVNPHDRPPDSYGGAPVHIPGEAVGINPLGGSGVHSVLCDDDEHGLHEEPPDDGGGLQIPGQVAGDKLVGPNQHESVFSHIESAEIDSGAVRGSEVPAPLGDDIEEAPVLDGGGTFPNDATAVFINCRRRM